MYKDHFYGFPFIFMYLANAFMESILHFQSIHFLRSYILWSDTFSHNLALLVHHSTVWVKCPIQCSSVSCECPIIDCLWFFKYAPRAQQAFVFSTKCFYQVTNLKLFFHIWNKGNIKQLFQLSSFLWNKPYILTDMKKKYN